MTSSVLRARRSTDQVDGPQPLLTGSPLAVRGAVASGAAAGTGLAVLVLVVVIGWMAAPHEGDGLTGVLRTAATAWLIGNHVGFVLAGTGPIGLLPLGLVLLPGALLWRAGRWVVRTGGVTRLRHVGLAALSVAVPYALIALALAIAARSHRAAPDVLQAVAGGFLLALAAAGLGGARALAPWRQLTGLMSDRVRAVVVGATGALAVLVAAGAALTAVSLAVHLHTFGTVNAALTPGAVGSVLLLLAQIGYAPNAIIWAISFTLGPGFAFGTGTVVAPTGVVLGPLPSFPLLTALPPGPHPVIPGAVSALLLAVPYLAGAFGGLLVARGGLTPSLEAAPLWGFASGVLVGAALTIAAWFAGGPLGNGRLAETGPSPWQTGLVAVLEVGVAAAISAGIANWLRYRAVLASHPRPAAMPPGVVGGTEPADLAAEDEHVRYVNPWADAEPAPRTEPAGPAALP
jgi:hypothetical protein